MDKDEERDIIYSIVLYPLLVFPENGGAILSVTSNQNPRPERRRKKPSTASAVLSTVGKVVGTLFLIGMITSVILACFAANYIRTVIIPQAHLDANFIMNQTSTIYYKDSATGEYVEHLALHGSENRKLVELDQIPKSLQQATVAIEDENFYKHNGVSWKSERPNFQLLS